MNVLLTTLLVLAAAPDATVQIEDAVLRLPPGGTGSGALYFTAKNTSTKPDRLRGAKTKVARHTMLHETVHEGDVAKMKHADQWPIPAGGTLVLAPNGKHVMLMGMKNTKPGDEVVVVLFFENAGEVNLKVRARTFADQQASDEVSPAP